MHDARELLRTLANELPIILRQIDHDDEAVQMAGRQRLADFAKRLAPWRGGLGREVSRRGLLRAQRAPGAVTFAAMSAKDD